MIDHLAGMGRDLYPDQLYISRKEPDFRVRALKSLTKILYNGILRILGNGAKERH